ncbi:DUF6286 domain-containing protein [Nocardia sp. CA2R105]|uniref:DUF6286 domain-containing protein n=1 Tax=Nocardia coffeae TaxID=2873381 RepID=UPI001CA6AB4F|nr:DUF6286 domain-containing protein [Nocardia coffeae]MBY8863858.1 DUF6286 domain-containing protein [Nocardia coffeae]
MRRRPRRALPAGVLAVALLAACAAAVGPLVQHLTGAREFVPYGRIVARLHGIAWDDRWVAVGGIVAIVAGLTLLMSAILPGRAVVLPLVGDDGFTAGVARRGLRGALQDAAQSVEGVRSARVRLRRKKVRIKIRTAYVHVAGLSERVGTAVDERMTRIGPDPAPRVVVVARRGGGSGGRRADGAVPGGDPIVVAGSEQAVGRPG